jgi:hypothetical protein
MGCPDLLAINKNLPIRDKHFDFASVRKLDYCVEKVGYYGSCFLQ